VSAAPRSADGLVTISARDREHVLSGMPLALAQRVSVFWGRDWPRPVGPEKTGLRT